jgi:hypothetical protein
MSAVATRLTQSEQDTIMTIMSAKDRIKAEMENTLYVKQCMEACMGRGMTYEDACIVLASYTLDRLKAMDEALHECSLTTMRMSVLIDNHKMGETC